MCGALRAATAAGAATAQARDAHSTLVAALIAAALCLHCRSVHSPDAATAAGSTYPVYSDSSWHATRRRGTPTAPAVHTSYSLKTGKSCVHSRCTKTHPHYFFIILTWYKLGFQ